jgi:Ca2+-binding EF-hand superfamily protein
MLALKIAIAQGKTVEQLPFYDLDGNGFINVGDMLQLKIVLMS